MLFSEKLVMMMQLLRQVALFINISHCQSLAYDSIFWAGKFIYVYDTLCTLTEFMSVGLNSTPFRSTDRLGFSKP